MPGGSPEAWPYVKPIFQAIAAKVADGSPCCDWVGEEGAGHFVKMVHNGIEYGDMQLVSESYDVTRHALGMTLDDIADVFSEWNAGRLNSTGRDHSRYLIQRTGRFCWDKIPDAAGQKGTGNKASRADHYIPLTDRAPCLPGPLALKATVAFRRARLPIRPSKDRPAFIEDLGTRLRRRSCPTPRIHDDAGSIPELGWNLAYGNIALMWRGGCIIRAAFLDDIKAAFENQPDLDSLLLDPTFRTRIQQAASAWRRVIATAVSSGLPVPAMSSALAFYDGYRRERLPANLLQAQRDYFGAHTYERIDRPRGEFLHTNWTGQGGQVTSTSYIA
jgi:6-phosphogluconate dehydrogenase